MDSAEETEVTEMIIFINTSFTSLCSPSVLTDSNKQVHMLQEMISAIRHIRNSCALIPGIGSQILSSNMIPYGMKFLSDKAKCINKEALEFKEEIKLIIILYQLFANYTICDTFTADNYWKLLFPEIFFESIILLKKIENRNALTAFIASIYN